MINTIFLFITGLTLFLFGMIKLSTEMQQLFSVRIREYIKFSVTKPLYGLLMGIGATILFQSSSATTLLTIGIVSAGLISFYHSLGIILGADIGTTLTAQLVVWKFTAVSPIFIFLGGILYFLGKERMKLIGEAILYFGLIFFGLNLIGEATAPLKHNQAFIRFFQETKHPLIGVIIGLIFTSIVHASAIPISILIILGQQGFIAIENALPIVLGANIGTTVTALMGSIVTNISGKRSAVSHLLFKCIGVIICMIALPLFIPLLKYLSSSIGQQIALGHFLLNCLIVVLFLFLLKPFSLVIEKIIPGKDETLPLWPEYLDEKCLSKAGDALLCVKKELKREIMLTQRMLGESLSLIPNFSEKKKRDITYIELIVDNVQAEITKYLWNISCGQLSQELSKRLFAFSTIVYDIERIGDRSTNLVELSESKHTRKTIFSEAANAELREVGKLVTKNLKDAALLIEQRDEEKIRHIFVRDKEVEFKIKEAIEKHLERFYRKVCRAEAGPIFVDMLINLEAISAHCRIIAEYIEGLQET
jgi:phosphate:Na+ symporter